eukprot:CAMPEP_0114985304 /NCGR_PEP_ID=MMETSP0216-20121206/7777_1 /TAXON_ID=223996 /ORGANISM="Protocruzia adherens, Strain Boccale" /LENGTH=528 /DNA_ID=CAMNT_0002347575 /DNA_START=103 /DNA_END=1686 /DNA_ORIENTATION=+
MMGDDFSCHDEPASEEKHGFSWSTLSKAFDSPWKAIQAYWNFESIPNHGKYDHFCIKRDCDLDDLCSPITVLPGYLASKLEILIDCQELQTSEPQIFDACGWNTCEDVQFWEFWKKKPEDRYNVWWYNIFGPLALPMNFWTPNCFRQLINLDEREGKQDFNMHFSSPRGTQVRISRQMDEDFECGLSAVESLGPTPRFGTQLSRSLGDLNQVIRRLGYQPGLTAFGLPYDWRVTPSEGRTSQQFRRILEFSKKMTGKRMVVFAFSYGNLQFLYNANQMNQEDKDRLIRHHIAAMPPFQGGGNSITQLLGSSVAQDFMLGGTTQDVIDFTSGTSSIFELIFKNGVELMKDEPFYKELLDRLKLEADRSKTPEWWKENGDSNPYPFMPNPSENCAGEYLDHRKRKTCFLPFVDMQNKPFLQIEEEQFYLTEKDLKRLMLDGYSPLMKPEFVERMYEKVAENKLNMNLNPNIEMTVIFASHLKTMQSAEYDYQPSQNYGDIFTEADREVYQPGDAILNTSGVLLGPLKWSW